jgi:uncharacterized protein (TIGR03435 family)
MIQRRMVVCAIALTTLGFAQPSNLPTFDAAAMKRPSAIDGSSWHLEAAGSMILRNVSLRALLEAALYKPGGSPPEGGPDWLDSERVDVVAKTASNTKFDAVRPMLLALLVERCKLTFHNQRLPKPVFALVKGGREPKLTMANPDERYNCDTGRTATGLFQEKCQGMTMALLSEELPNLEPRDIDRRVVDETGITGAYDFALEWTRTRPAPGEPEPEQHIVTMFEAIETQLGLKLEKRNLPVDVVLIDGIQRPRLDN